MASYIERNGRWRAEVCIKPFRKQAKTFASRELAAEWADQVTAFLVGFRDRGMTDSAGAPFPDPITLANVHLLPRFPALSPAVGIYFLFRGDDCIYVGQSKQVHIRVQEHRARRNGKKEFDSYSWIAAAPEELDRLELHYISTLKPALNQMGSELVKLKRKAGSL